MSLLLISARIKIKSNMVINLNMQVVHADPVIRPFNAVILLERPCIVFSSLRVNVTNFAPIVFANCLLKLWRCF